jgi:hypothetical protein
MTSDPKFTDYDSCPACGGKGTCERPPRLEREAPDDPPEVLGTYLAPSSSGPPESDEPPEEEECPRCGGDGVVPPEIGDELRGYYEECRRRGYAMPLPANVVDGFEVLRDFAARTLRDGMQVERWLRILAEARAGLVEDTDTEYQNALAAADQIARSEEAAATKAATMMQRFPALDGTEIGLDDWTHLFGTVKPGSRGRAKGVPGALADLLVTKGKFESSEKAAQRLRVLARRARRQAA